MEEREEMEGLPGWPVPELVIQGSGMRRKQRRAGALVGAVRSGSLMMHTRSSVLLPEPVPPPACEGRHE